jgi:Fe-S cluster biogenesis protein NfuA
MAASVSEPLASVAPEKHIEPRPRGEFSAKTERVEMLAAKLDQSNDPEVRATALELVQSVIELHGAALQRLIDKCIETPGGERVLDEALQDDLVSSMFLLHSLHPDDIETRVLRGIEAVRPYLKSHGGDCELVAVNDGIVRLRLHGTCGSCPSSSLTLKNAVEEALYEAAPDIKEIVAENAAADHAQTGKLVVLK